MCRLDYGMIAGDGPIRKPDGRGASPSENCPRRYSMDFKDIVHIREYDYQRRSVRGRLLVAMRLPDGLRSGAATTGLRNAAVSSPLHWPCSTDTMAVSPSQVLLFARRTRRSRLHNGRTL